MKKDMDIRKDDEKGKREEEGNRGKGKKGEEKEAKRKVA